MDALLIETELLLDWYLPRLGIAVMPTMRDTYLAHWRTALMPVQQGARTWVLRDYHSPNLMWLANRSGLGRVGLLDFQDAVMGSPAYDVASLLQDARVDVPEAMEVALLSHYVRARLKEPGFDARRDGKPQYLRHLPRVWTYLQRALAHPALAQLRNWYGAHVPAPKAR
jgi:aminoglycoside/choline kinase family phosphotransferase